MNEIIMDNVLGMKMSSQSSVDDLGLIENETFDFDLPLSPQECPGAQLIELDKNEDPNDDDDEEVFFGAVGFKEQCVATNAELTIAEQKPMSPPTAEQYALLFKEAMALSVELRTNSSKSGSSSGSSSSDTSSERKIGGRKSSCAPSLGSIEEGLSIVEVDTSVAEKPDGDCEKAACDDGRRKSELERYKREVKKDIRGSARRGTYTIATDQPSPYPSEENPSKAQSRIVQPRPPTAKGGVVPRGRGSMLPKRGLRIPAPVSNGKGEGAGNPEAATKIPCSGIQKPVKRLANPKASGLMKPGFSSGVKPTIDVTAETKTEAASSTKLPTKKMGLMKPSAISRPVQRNGTSASAANKPQPMKATVAFKADSSGPRPTANGIGPTKKTTATSQVPSTGKRKIATPHAATPCTPVVQEKKVIPKRILASGSGAITTPAKGAVTPRRSSISALRRPSTPVQQPSTPHTRHTSITVPPSSVGPAPARRRSGIPTPNRRPSTTSRPASRLAAPAAVSRPQSVQPAQKESSRFSPLLLSPLLTPPSFDLSPPDGPGEAKASKPPSIPVEESSAPPPNPTGSSPDFTTSTSKTPNPSNVLRTRTNLQESVQESSPLIKMDTPKEKPKLGMLIDFGSATPKEKKSMKAAQDTAKENLLIDL